VASPFFTAYTERSAETKATAPDPIPRTSGGPGAGKVGTYTHPKVPAPRKVHKRLGRRVKTSMVENF
jgi:hypothetical protein